MIEGFSHFVTSMTAPIASGWSIFAGWDLHPLESAAFHGAPPVPPKPELWRYGRVHSFEPVILAARIRQFVAQWRSFRSGIGEGIDVSGQAIGEDFPRNHLTTQFFCKPAGRLVLVIHVSFNERPT